MPDNEKEPEIDGKLNVNVYVPTAATKAIIEALPPTTSIEDRKTIAEMLKQHEEETRKSFEKEREERKKEHEDVVKWRRISFALGVISCL